jgi:hypothetical protein
MKRCHLILVLALGGLVVLTPGCGKNAETENATPAPASPPKPVEAAVPATKESPEKQPSLANQPKPAAVVVSNAPPAVTNVETVAAPATNAVADNPAAVQEIIDTARKLIADQKWAEVAQTLSKLQGANLTPEQEKSLLDLKDQLEKMIRDAVGK